MSWLSRGPSHTALTLLPPWLSSSTWLIVANTIHSTPQEKMDRTPYGTGGLDDQDVMGGAVGFP